MFEAQEAIQANPDHQPVDPIDLEAGLAAAVVREPAEAAIDGAKVLTEMRDLVAAGAMVASSMRALSYLFIKAVADDGTHTELTSASYLVADCIETMAARLEALEAKASNLYGPFISDYPTRAGLIAR